MERVLEPKKSLVTTLMDSYQLVRSRPDFTVYSQMPTQQIKLFITQAARKEYYVIIQLNPSSFSKEYTEVAGTISLSTCSSHIIMRTKTDQTVHLIQPRLIRHIRIA